MEFNQLAADLRTLREHSPFASILVGSRGRNLRFGTAENQLVPLREARALVPSIAAGAFERLVELAPRLVLNASVQSDGAIVCTTSSSGLAASGYLLPGGTGLFGLEAYHFTLKKLKGSDWYRWVT
jgi:hypothetical protein